MYAYTKTVLIREIRAYKKKRVHHFDGAEKVPHLYPSVLQ